MNHNNQQVQQVTVQRLQILGNHLLISPKGHSTSNSCTERPSSSEPPTPAQWEQHRTALKQLYINEDRTVKFIQIYMLRQYGFRATTSMYKKRFAKWEFFKNNRLEDVRIVLKERAAADSSLAGIPSETTLLRGEPVDMVDVKRYLRRKGLSIADVASLRPAPRLPRTLDPWIAQDRAIQSISQYVDQSITSGKWFSDAQKLSSRLSPRNLPFVNIPYYWFSVGLNLIQRNDVETGFTHLHRGCELVKPHLTSESPGLINTARYLLLFWNGNKPEAVSALLDHYRHMASLLHGPMHPFALLFSVLRHCPVETRACLMENIWGTLDDQVAQLLTDTRLLQVTAEAAHERLQRGVGHLIEHGNLMEIDPKSYNEEIADPFGDTALPIEDISHPFDDFNAMADSKYDADDLREPHETSGEELDEEIWLDRAGVMYYSGGWGHEDYLDDIENGIQGMMLSI